MKASRSALLLAGLACSLAAACSKAPPSESTPAKHEHHPPHGGVPVVLGDEAYHLELILDPAEGKLQAYLLDGELENFVRSAAPSLEITATVAGARQSLVLRAVANPATGETVGDTSLFEGRADWLRTVGHFDAVLESLTIRGTTFTHVAFNYPKGNDAGP